MEVPLLRAKLTVPATPVPCVSRPALVGHLEERRLQGARASLLVAPAGCGKSTLAASWIGSAGLAAAWLVLDERDNLPERFLRYLVAALETPFPGITDRLGPSVRGPTFPPPVALVEMVAAAVEAAAPAGPAVLVLDDLHAVKEPPVIAAIDRLLEVLPGGLHAVLLSREPPPLRLQRLRVRGALAEIGAERLAFDRDEAGRFLEAVAGHPVPSPTADTVHRFTGGWAAALRFAALRLADPRGREDAPLPAAPASGGAGVPGRGEILDFLFEEVLAGQPSELRGFLVRASLFDRVSAPLCTAVLGGDAPLGRAGVAGLLLPPHDDREWYRFHPLIRDLLRERLASLPCGEERALRLAAASWFRERGLLEEALDHLFRAGAHDRAAEILETEARRATIWDALSVGTFLAALRHIPDLERRPWLSLYAARVGFIGGRSPEAADRLEGLRRRLADGRAAPALPPDEVRQLRVAALSDVASYAVVPGEADRALAALDEAAPLVGPDEHGMHGKLETIRGMALLLRGDVAGADAAFARALERARRFPVPMLEATVLCSAAEVRWQQGRLGESLRLCEAAGEIGRGTPGGAAAAGLASLLKARVLHERDRLPEAEEAARRGLAAVGAAGITDSFGLGRAILAGTLASRGAGVEALRILADARASIAGYGTRRLLARLEAAEANAALRCGELERAAVWADAYAARPPAPYLLDDADLAFHRVRLRQARAREAERGLVALAAAAGTGGRARAFLEARLLLALARFAAGDKEPAFSLAAAVVAEAAAEGYVRLFLDEGAAALELLRQARRRAPMPAYTAVLLRGFERGAAPAAVSPSAHGLSPREAEVLALLSERLSNDEIAGRLFVSLPTVKTHVRHILEKLGAATRRDAVRRAREAGLLG